MSQHPGRDLFLAVLCIPTALQHSPRLGSTLPKGGWHDDSPPKVSATSLSPFAETPHKFLGCVGPMREFKLETAVE